MPSPLSPTWFVAVLLGAVVLAGIAAIFARLDAVARRVAVLRADRRRRRDWHHRRH